MEPTTRGALRSRAAGACQPAAAPPVPEAEGVLVVVEQHGGRAHAVSWQLLGQGRRLADTLGAPLLALVLGQDVRDLASEAIAYGAERVYLANHPCLREYRSQPYAQVTLDLIRAASPEIVLIGATATGRDLAGAVATRIPTGLTADCTMLAVEPPPSRLLLASRPAFSEKLMATILCKRHRPQMATARPGVFQALPRDPARRGEIEPLDVRLDEAQIAAQVLEVIHDPQRVRLDDAEVIVAGGRGCGGPAAFALLAQLAAALGGEVAATRAAVEAGWAPHARQVGQTGQTVRPRLYIACGISGAIQHLVGMERSEVIVAINRDPGAPVFQVADVGIVGDLSIVLPALVAEARTRGGAALWGDRGHAPLPRYPTLSGGQASAPRGEAMTQEGRLAHAA